MKLFSMLTVLNFKLVRMIVTCIFVDFKDQVSVKSDIIEDICTQLADIQDVLAVDKIKDKIILDKIEIMNEGSAYYLIVLFPYHVFPNLAKEKIMEFAEYDKISISDKLSILKVLVSEMIKRANSLDLKDPKNYKKLINLQTKIANLATNDNLEVGYCDSDNEIDAYEYSSETDDEIYIPNVEENSVVFINNIPGRKRRMKRSVEKDEETEAKKLKIHYS